MYYQGHFNQQDTFRARMKYLNKKYLNKQVLSQQKPIAIALPKKGIMLEQISLAMTNHFFSHYKLPLVLLYQGW